LHTGRWRNTNACEGIGDGQGSGYVGLCLETPLCLLIGRSCIGRRLDDKSRMSRDVQVRICERLGVRFPRATRLVILVSGTREDAEAEKAALATYLKQTTGLELSPEKTRVTDLREGFEFLGHRVRLKWHHQFGLMPRIEIPRHKQADLRRRVKRETRRDSLPSSLTDRLQRLNRLLRGWGNFYRFCTGAGAIFNHLDYYVGDRLWRWLMKKHKGLRRQRSSIRPLRSLVRPTCVVWREGETEQFLLRTLPVQRFRRGWMLLPRFASVPGEPDA
jgi:RNA-directed DNA polymerase